MKKILTLIIMAILLVISTYANPVFLNNEDTHDVNVGSTLSFQLNVSNADNGTNTFSKNSALGTLNSATGQFSYAAISTDLGSHVITFNVSDANSSSTKNITINVLGAGLTYPSLIVIGDSSQEREETVTESFTITNVGSVNINNIQMSYVNTLSGFSSSSFNVTLTGVPTSLTPSQSATITMTAYVPKNFDAGQRKIGELRLTSSQINTTTTLDMSAENKLIIDKVEIDVGTESETVSDGETIDARREDDVTLTITVENTFSDSSNIEMNDVVVEVDSNSLDINEESDSNDIAEDDQETFTISFSIPDDADDGRHDVTITVTGEDENGAEHSEEFNFEFDVDVKSKEVIILSSEFSPKSICKDVTNAKLTIEIKNSGTKDLEKAQVYVEGDNFVFSKRVNSIILDEGDSKSLTMDVSIPAGTAKGIYYFNIFSYYDVGSDTKTDTSFGILEIKDCAPTTPTTPTTPTNQTNVVIQPYQPGSGAVYGKPISTSQGFFSDKTFMVLLVIANILLLILIVLVIANLGKRR